MNPVTFLDEYRRKKTEAADAVYRDELLAIELYLRSPIDSHPFASSLYALVERLDRLFRLNPDRTMFQAESELRDIADCLEQLGYKARYHEVHCGAIGVGSDDPEIFIDSTAG